jgi:hypothetical protein
MGFPNIVYGHESDTFADDDTQGVPVGTKLIIEDGRAYRYAKADSTALVAALLNSGPIPEVAKYGDQPVGTIAVGATSITGVGSATTDMGIDQLVNGYCWSEQTTQLGPAQRIKSNTLISNGAETGTITLYEGLAIAYGASDTISYVRNTWRNIIIHATSEAAEVAGVTVCAVAASVWAWVQVHGPAKVQTSGTPVVGAMMQAVGAGAGEIAEASAATDNFIARFISWEQANEDGLFFLVIE